METINEEKKYIVTTYKASDGKIFKDKYERQLYEDRLIGLGIERDLHIRENAKVKDLI